MADEHALLEEIKLLRQHVFRLVEKYDQARSEIDLLKKEKEALNKTIDSQNDELKSFLNQEKISKIATSVKVEGQNTTELKTQINEYIKEIDQCIALLSE